MRLEPSTFRTPGTEPTTEPLRIIIDCCFSDGFSDPYLYPSIFPHSFFPASVQQSIHADINTCMHYTMYTYIYTHACTTQCTHTQLHIHKHTCMHYTYHFAIPPRPLSSTWPHLIYPYFLRIKNGPANSIADPRIHLSSIINCIWRRINHRLVCHQVANSSTPSEQQQWFIADCRHDIHVSVVTRPINKLHIRSG